MTRPALIVVDVQKSFCPGGSLAVADGDIVATNITSWIKAHYDDYVTIVATKDWHETPGPHFASFDGSQPDFRTTWPDHCVANTEGAEFHSNLDTTFIRHVFYKGKTKAAYSGFEGENEYHQPLAQHLQQRGIDSVDVVGLATDYCVKATALDAVKHGFETTVLVDLTAAVAEATLSEALDEMAHSGVRLVHAL